MFEITIKGETLQQLASNVLVMAKQYQETTSAVAEDFAARDAAARKAIATPKTQKPAAKAEKEYTAADEEDTPPEPMPAGAAAVVDAGTGQPVAKAVEAEVKQMTRTDVKVAAAKLAVIDTPKLASILKKYNAAKLSEVDPDVLGDFAGEVIDALG